MIRMKIQGGQDGLTRNMHRRQETCLGIW